MAISIRPLTFHPLKFRAPDVGGSGGSVKLAAVERDPKLRQRYAELMELNRHDSGKTQAAAELASFKFIDQGLTAAGQKDYVSAAAFFQRAVEVCPDNVHIYEQAAMIKGIDADQRFGYIAVWRELQPNSGKALICLIEWHSEAGQHGLAALLADFMIRAGYRQALILRGRAFANAGCAREALQDYRTFVREFPHSPFVGKVLSAIGTIEADQAAAGRLPS